MGRGFKSPRGHLVCANCLFIRWLALFLCFWGDFCLPQLTKGLVVRVQVQSMDLYKQNSRVFARMGPKTGILVTFGADLAGFDPDYRHVR